MLDSIKPTFIDAHSHQTNDRYIVIYQQVINEPVFSDALFSIGIHPQHAVSFFENEFKTIFSFAEKSNCVAIGEIGLDNRLDVPMIQQEAVYIEQLKIAKNVMKPVVLHCVGAWDRCRILHQQYCPNEYLIYHGFAKTTILTSVLEYEKAMLSIGSRLMYDERLQEAVKTIPLERLFLETDTVEMDVFELYELLAKLKSIPLQTIIDQLYSNFLKLKQ